VLVLAEPRAALELTGLGSRGGLEVLEGEVPKTPRTGRSVRRGESWGWQQVREPWGLWSTKGGQGLQVPCSPQEGQGGTDGGNDAV